MAGVEKNKLSAFLNSGIYRLPNSNAIFLDPVRTLSRNYSQFRVSPSAYYSRFFTSKSDAHAQPPKHELDEESRVSSNTRKRKRNHKNKNNKQHYALNEKELLAEQRHQEMRPLLVKAHEELLSMKELLEVMCELNCETEGWESCIDVSKGGVKEEVSFVELGKVYQAPFYEIALGLSQVNYQGKENRGSSACPISQRDDRRLLPIFNNLVLNEMNEDVVAEFITSRYILPKDSSFYMLFLHLSYYPCESRTWGRYTT